MSPKSCTPHKESSDNIMKLGLSHHFGSFAGGEKKTNKKKSRKAPFGHVAQPPQLWSLITRGTMGQLSSYSSEGNIFTTQRSMEKAAVSEDFSLCPHTPPFPPPSPLLSFYLRRSSVVKHPWCRRLQPRLYLSKESDSHIYCMPRCWMKPLSI